MTDPEDVFCDVMDILEELTITVDGQLEMEADDERTLPTRLEDLELLLDSLNEFREVVENMPLPEKLVCEPKPKNPNSLCDRLQANLEALGIAEDARWVSLSRWMKMCYMWS